ncbi:MAG: hypothetical protein ACREE0_19185 [Phenylobacterium sp.]
MAIGTCTHGAALIYGWNNRVPFASVIFWNSLTVLDPLAAALLFLRPRIGVVLTLAIMVSDVGHNIWAIAAFEANVWLVAAQVLFLIFVLVTARLIWRDAPGQSALVRNGSNPVVG